MSKNLFAKEKKIAITFRLKESLVNYIKEVADKNDISQVDVVTTILEDYKKNNKN